MAFAHLPVSSLTPPGYAHYGIAWSPFNSSRLALCSSANYGLVGNGQLHIISLGPPDPRVSSTKSPSTPEVPGVSLEKRYTTQDGLYGVAWSEVHENQLVSAGADGSIHLWDITLNDLPVQVWKEHSREVWSVDWSNIKKDVFCSSSWDGTIKLWSPDRAHSITTLYGGQGCIYQAVFSPHHPDLIASGSADGALRIYDLRSPSLLSAPTSLTSPSSTPALIIPRTEHGELLSLDWNKYRPMVLAAGGTNPYMRVWDCRMVKPSNGLSGQAQEFTKIGGVCESELEAHTYAIRRLQWSPHRADIIATASYDMTCKVWSVNPPPGTHSLVHVEDRHSEFVVGCAWSLYDEGLLASCGWDGRLNLCRPLGA